MATRYFEPIGEVPIWELIYDALQGRKSGDVITYDEIKAKTGIDIKADRSSFYKAKDALLKNQNQALSVVPRLGYRVVSALAHERIAKTHTRRSRRQLMRAHNAVRYVNHNDLPQDASERFRRLEAGYAEQAAIIRRMERRIARNEELLSHASTKSNATEQRLTELEEKLRLRGLI